jgi:hypothetical protein
MTPEHKFALLTTFGPAALSAVIAAVVSWLVTRAVLKNSPDYQQQLNDLRTEMGRVGAAQEGILAHYRELSADEQSRREAAQWHPAMELRSDRQAMTNSLYIAADQHFRVDRIRIKTNSGAVVETLPGESAQMVRMAEVLIPSQALVELTQRDPDFLRNEKTVGKLECVLEVGIVPQQRTFEFAFRVIQDATRHDGGLNMWRRMDGRL